MERVIRERMTTQEMETVTPKTLINIRPITAAKRNSLVQANFHNLWTKLILLPN